MRECRKCGENKQEIDFYGCRKICKSCFTHTYNKYNCKKCGELINKNSHQCTNCKRIKLEKDGKKCCRCKLQKQISEFSKITKGSKCFRSNCKSCEVIKSKEYKKNNPEIARKQRNNWAKNNPITVKKMSIRTKLKKHQFDGDLETKVEEVFNCNICECCGNTFELKSDKHIDHCHETNKYRGLICRSCNHALGHCKDSVEVLQSCINYLNKFKGN